MLEHFSENMRLIGVTPITKVTENMVDKTVEGEPYNIEGALFRLSGRDVKNAPDGQYTTEDIKIYYALSEPKRIQKGYLVNVNDGETYVAQAPKPREEGNFIIVFCKKKV